MMSQEPTEAVAKAMADIDAAFKAATAAIEADADPERAFAWPRMSPRHCANARPMQPISGC